MAEEPARAVLRLFERVDEVERAQSVRDLGLLQDVGELARPKKLHRRHADTAGLEDGEPAGDQHRVVGRAQQDPVAGNQPALLGQHPGDPVRQVQELSVGPGRVVEMEYRPAAMPRCRRPVEELDAAIDPGRDRPELRQTVVIEDRPQFARRQVAGREPVAMGRGAAAGFRHRSLRPRSTRSRRRPAGGRR